MGEIGKNMTAVEYGDDIVVIDCGLKFPEGEMLGVDFVVPDISYLEDNKKKIKALLLTHGHEDHIGGIPLIAHRIDAPIYGAALTIELVKSKMSEAKVNYRPKYHKVTPGRAITAGVFEIGFVRVSHSIPDALALKIKTPLGVIFHSGDFKLDLTPRKGEDTDLSSISEIGREGVMMLMSDSTNSEREGFTPSETSLSRTFDDIFRRHKDRRIVVASFASNLYRAETVITTAAKFNRKVVLVGRSMIAYVELAKKLGYINVADDALITPAEADTMPMNRVAVLTTGSQGEPFSGLVTMSKGAHKQVKLGPNDLVVVSATPIPGNEKLVSNTVNRLFECGCEVIYERSSAIHVSGHASREEQKILLSLVKPKHFIPCHGEYRHLVRHGQIAEEIGINPKNIFIMKNGNVLTITATGARMTDSVPSGDVLVDGVELGEHQRSILRQRRELSESGLLAISAVVNEKYELLAQPVVESRGSLFEIDKERMIPEVQKAVEKAVAALRSGAIELEALPTEMRKRTREILGKNFKAYPSIMPLISVVPQNPKQTEQSRSRNRRRRSAVAKTKRGADS